jgi:hypothetical protein
VFRFGTSDLLAASQKKEISRRSMNIRLGILQDQEYIGRLYDEDQKRRTQFATYYLLPKAIDELKKNPDKFRKSVLRNISSDVIRTLLLSPKQTHRLTSC